MTTNPEMISANPAALAAFLHTELDADVDVGHLQPATAGARRINVLFDATVDGVDRPMVITQLPNESDAFRDVAAEVRWLRAAAAANVRVAHVVASDPDGAEHGGPFFITDRVDGVSIPKQVVDLCARTDGLGASVAHEIGASMARLHAVSTSDVPDDAERPEGSAIDAAYAHIEENMSELLQPSPAFALATRWLHRNEPAAEPLVPIHGDVRNGNILVGSGGLGAILDWETAHLGERFEDLAWLAQRMWRARNDTLEIGGFGNRSDVQAGYESAGGEWDEDRFHWWKVYRTIWWGLGLARQGRQHLDGTFRSIIMAGSGRRVAELEWDALALIKGRP